MPRLKRDTCLVSALKTLMYSLLFKKLNPASKSIIWRSISQNKLTDTMSAQQRNDFIVKEIALMLSDYPPQTKQP